MTGFTRRGVLALLASACAACLSALPRRVAAGTPKPAVPADTLATVIETLLPHEGLDAAFYGKAAMALRRSMQGSGDEAALEKFLAALVRLAGGADSWANAASDAREAALRALEQDPFFARLLNGAIEHVYRDPRLWQRIGYGGNALAQGGYLHRGFNDIGWLPRDGA